MKFCKVYNNTYNKSQFIIYEYINGEPYIYVYVVNDNIDSFVNEPLSIRGLSLGDLSWLDIKKKNYGFVNYDSFGDLFADHPELLDI